MTPTLAVNPTDTIEQVVRRATHVAVQEGVDTVTVLGLPYGTVTLHLPEETQTAAHMADDEEWARASGAAL